jgi:hypothetical protein
MSRFSFAGLGRRTRLRGGAPGSQGVGRLGLDGDEGSLPRACEQPVHYAVVRRGAPDEPVLAAIDALDLEFLSGLRSDPSGAAPQAARSLPSTIPWSSSDKDSAYTARVKSLASNPRDTGHVERRLILCVPLAIGHQSNRLLDSRETYVSALAARNVTRLNRQSAGGRHQGGAHPRRLRSNPAVDYQP